jgi:hypothetical protein
LEYRRRGLVTAVIDWGMTQPSDDLRRKIVTLLRQSADLREQASTLLKQAEALRREAEALQDDELRRQAGP